MEPILNGVGAIQNRSQGNEAIYIETNNAWVWQRSCMVTIMETTFTMAAAITVIEAATTAASREAPSLISLH